MFRWRSAPHMGPADSGRQHHTTHSSAPERATVVLPTTSARSGGADCRSNMEWIGPPHAQFRSSRSTPLGGLDRPPRQQDLARGSRAPWDGQDGRGCNASDLSRPRPGCELELLCARMSDTSFACDSSSEATSSCKHRLYQWCCATSLVAFSSLVMLTRAAGCSRWPLNPLRLPPTGCAGDVGRNGIVRRGTRLVGVFGGPEFVVRHPIGTTPPTWPACLRRR